MICPLADEETLFFPKTELRLRELDGVVDACERHPDVGETVVLCESERYSEGVRWLRSRPESNSTLRVVHIDPERAIPEAALCVHLCEELGLARSPGEVWTVSIPSGPEETAE